LSVSDAIAALKAQLADPTSALRTGTVTAAVDESAGMETTYETPSSDADLRDDPDGLLMQSTTPITLRSGTVARLRVFTAEELNANGVPISTAAQSPTQQFLYLRCGER
jgi:hypothetical protein